MAGRAKLPLAPLATSAVLVLSACLENSTALDAVRALQGTVLGGADLAITREAVTNLPYASMSARVGRGIQGLLLLSHTRGDEQVWRAEREAVLVLRYGRLVRTAGFNEDLVGSQDLEEDPLEYGLHRLTSPRRFSRTMDSEPGGRYGQPVDCVVESVGPRKITIVEVEFDTVLAREDCEARLVHWRFTNWYWVDPVDGFVWRSTQHFARSLPALEYNILKPAG
jgi:hypothetical protein